jgi:dTDP-glucose 4,6-dehydratase
LQNLADVVDDPRFEFVRGDIADAAAVAAALSDVDAVVNFAAESHVDRSILDATPFIRTNIAGTHVLLDGALACGIDRFLQISTDEVYGSLGPVGKFTESTPLAPNSPYSASKAGADLLVYAYHRTHGVPTIILRSSNAYGPYQFPEKLIPLMISNALGGRTLPVYGDGQHVRDWVHVEDLSSAVLTVLESGATGEVYNVGGGNELPNLFVVESIVELTGAPREVLQFVPDRPGHDRRYAMDHSKITELLGWQPERDFERGLAETVTWYLSNTEWVASVQSGEYRDYYDRQYSARLAKAKQQL